MRNVRKKVSVSRLPDKNYASNKYFIFLPTMHSVWGQVLFSFAAQASSSIALFEVHRHRGLVEHFVKQDPWLSLHHD